MNCSHSLIRRLSRRIHTPEPAAADQMLHLHSVEALQDEALLTETTHTEAKM